MTVKRASGLNTPSCGEASLCVALALSVLNRSLCALVFASKSFARKMDTAPDSTATFAAGIPDTRTDSKCVGARQLHYSFRDTEKWGPTLAFLAIHAR